MVQLSWSNFLKNQFTKPLGPSLGLSRMWTKRNDHAPKSECVDFFNICPKKAVLKKNSSLTILFSSLKFIFSSPKFFLSNNCYASMVKWTKKVLCYTKTIIFLVKGLKVVAKSYLNWIFFYDDLYCCVKYSTVEYRVEIFNT